MSWPSTIAILMAAYGLVYLQSWFVLPRLLLGAQPDLLPSLMVYAALRSNVPTVALTAVLAGFCVDSLSASPFGVSVLPLALAGLTLHAVRGTLLVEDRYIQFLLGLAASAGVPLVQLLLILATGREPLCGLWFPWRWAVVALVGGLCTPLWFRLFARIDRALSYPPEAGVPFRPDREIERGRDPHADH